MYTWFCLTKGPDHREGGGTGPFLSSHRWDISRHAVYEGQLWRKEEEERRGIEEGKKGNFITVNESISSVVGCRCAVVDFNSVVTFL